MSRCHVERLYTFLIRIATPRMWSRKTKRRYRKSVLKRTELYG
jgi:hypothetical protein